MSNVWHPRPFVEHQETGVTLDKIVPGSLARMQSYFGYFSKSLIVSNLCNTLQHTLLIDDFFSVV